MPKDTKIFIKVCQKEDMRRTVQAVKRAGHKKAVLTSSVELTGRWVSREVLAIGAFFRRLEAREEVLFLTAASSDLATTAAS
jgi:hypothetical protein